MYEKEDSYMQLTKRKADNLDLLKLLNVNVLYNYSNTRQNILIKLTANPEKYKGWLGSQQKDAMLTDNFREDACCNVMNDIMLYVFGCTGGYPEVSNSREEKLAESFWAAQNLARPDNVKDLLACEQLADYLIYESRRNYAIGCEAYTDRQDPLPDELTVRLQSARPLDMKWEQILEIRLNRLFADAARPKYLHDITCLYDLAGIMLVNINKE